MSAHKLPRCCHVCTLKTSIQEALNQGWTKINGKWACGACSPKPEPKVRAPLNLGEPEIEAKLERYETLRTKHNRNTLEEGEAEEFKELEIALEKNWLNKPKPPKNKFDEDLESLRKDSEQGVTPPTKSSNGFRGLRGLRLMSFLALAACAPGYDPNA